MKLTSKERNFLRKKAHNIDPVVRIGKSGLTDKVLESIKLAIDKQELVKVKILSNSLEEVNKELETEIEKYSKATTVSNIGHTMIFFKENKKGAITLEFMDFRKKQTK